MLQENMAERERDDRDPIYHVSINVGGGNQTYTSRATVSTGTDAAEVTRPAQNAKRNSGCNTEKCAVCLDPFTENRKRACVIVFCKECVHNIFDDVTPRKQPKRSPSSALNLNKMDCCMCNRPFTSGLEAMFDICFCWECFENLLEENRKTSASCEPSGIGTGEAHFHLPEAENEGEEHETESDDNLLKSLAKMVISKKKQTPQVCQICEETFLQESKSSFCPGCRKGLFRLIKGDNQPAIPKARQRPHRSVTDQAHPQPGGKFWVSHAALTPPPLPDPYHYHDHYSVISQPVMSNAVDHYMSMSTPNLYMSYPTHVHPSRRGGRNSGRQPLDRAILSHPGTYEGNSRTVFSADRVTHNPLYAEEEDEYVDPQVLQDPIYHAIDTPEEDYSDEN